MSSVVLTEWTQRPHEASKPTHFKDNQGLGSRRPLFPDTMGQSSAGDEGKRMTPQARGSVGAEGHGGCIHCSLDLDITMPEGLVEAAHCGQVVIFAGAGISTEVATVFPDTVLDMAASRLGVDDPQSFPETLQAFQTRFGRPELVRMVKKKFDYIDSFPGPRLHARKFHQELATMPYIRDIATTNWDPYFEEECGATPFVTGEDIALYEMPGRRVLKIHGSISNLSSIVATETDYARRLDELGSNVMGGLLRQMLATKTVVFIGYSLRDWNFRRLYAALRADMKDYAPRAYLVSPFASDQERDEDFGLRALHTSGVRFLRDLKEQMVGHCFIDDFVYDIVDDLYDAILKADRVAKDISHKEFPAIIFCWAYHDGVRDACFRILRRRRSGEYSQRQHVVSMCEAYDSMYDRAYEAERFADAAYIDGYVNGLMMLLSDKADAEELVDNVPLYFVYGSDSAMRSEDEFREGLQNSRRRAPKVRKKAREISDRLDEGMVVSHVPFLSDVPGEG